MGKGARSSRSVRVVIPEDRRGRNQDGGRTRKTFLTKVLRTNAIIEDNTQAEQDYARNVAGLDPHTVSALAAMRGEGSSSSDAIPGVEENDVPMDVDPVEGDEEEWVDMEDGVEADDAAMQEVMEFVQSYRQYEDKRTWRQRVQRSDEHWKQVMPTLVNAYIRWRYPAILSPDAPSGASSSTPHDDAAPPEPSGMHSGPPSCNDTPSAPQEDPSTPPEPLNFDISVYNLFDVRATVTISSLTATSPVEALALSGYLSATPIHAAVAISFSTLELLRCIRLFKASYSIESYAKLVCYYYQIPYRRTVRNWLSDTFDIYLGILRDVKKGIDHALGRDSPDWRVRNSCPACCHVLADEPAPKFSRMYCMDGNNSLKRMRPLGGRKAGDQRVFEDSDYFLPQDFVNGFANEVRVKAVRKGETLPSLDTNALTDDPVRMDDDLPPPDFDAPSTLPLNQPCADVPIIDNLPLPQAPIGDGDAAPDPVDSLPAITVSEPDIEGDPTDGAGPDQSTCTKNWKAAQSDDKKQSWDVFEETGVFASACRHGFMLWIIDMVRSGELARYPLATVAKVLEVIGAHTMGGYDVGCTLDGTVRRSSLGQRFDEMKSRLCVNAFHGYSHEYSCQVKYHPNAIEGFGLEDLETLERVFSASNALAPIIRYATSYRRRVLIDAFFRQWDDDKYLNLGKMLYENYRQALAIIREQSLVVADAMESLGLKHDDLAKYAAEEREYLKTLGKESSQDLHEIAYVEALQELRSVALQLSKTNRAFLASAPTVEVTFLPPHSGPTNYEAETSRTRKIETDRRYLDDRRKVLTLEVADLEVRLGIQARWQPSDPDYMRVSRYVATRRYQRALATLQRLVVQRLFELHKMNLARTGYRMRRHIAKNMQTRSRALRNAIQAYNTAADALDPPRPKLDWDTISHYQLLQEFDLLNETRADIREKPWAQPAVRETLRLAQRLERAREELVIVEREARRVHTAIRDENVMFTLALTRLQCEHSKLHGPLLEFATRRRAASAHVMVALRKLYALPDFKGNTKPGLRAGANTVHPSADSNEFRQVLDTETAAVDDDERHGGGAGVDDDDALHELTDLTTFMDGLST